MAHTITAKLNKAARKHQGQNGTTFFVSLGEKNYSRVTKQNEWTNYEAALFAKDTQVGFYESALIEHAVIQVTGSGIIIDNSNPAYPAKLQLLNAQLGFVSSPSNQAPQQQGGYQQQAPQQAPPQQQAPQAGYVPPHQQPVQQQAPQAGYVPPHQQPVQQPQAPQPAQDSNVNYDDDIPF